MPPASAVLPSTRINPVTIELTADYAKVSYDDNGVKKERIGDLMSVMDIFKSVDSSLILPILPFNCRRYIKRGNTITLFMYYEEGVIPEFNYYSEKIKVPTPKTLLIATLNEVGDGRYRLVQTALYALKETYLNSDAIQLYHWPMPNMSPEYMGRNCWGNDPTIELFRKNCSLFDMSQIYHVYFAARGNDDYGWRCATDSYTKIPDFLKGKDKFPYNQLREVAGKTVAHYIRDIVAGS